MWAPDMAMTISPAAIGAASLNDLRFYNKALELGGTFMSFQVERPGITQLFEDGYLVRGFTDCAFPYEDCNPAVHQVQRQYLHFYETDDDGRYRHTHSRRMGAFLY